MKMPRRLGALMALGALTALPACSSSMFGGHGEHAAATAPQYSQQNYTPPASYNTGAANQTAMNNEEPVPTSPALVRKVQRELKHHGDYRGRIDGIWGPMTEAGVRKWQHGHNLHVSGAIDMATLQSMDISAGNQNQENNRGNNENYGNNGQSTQPYGNNNGQSGNEQNSGNNNGQNASSQGYGNNGMNGGPVQGGVNNGAGSGQGNQASSNGTNSNDNMSGNQNNGSSANNMPTPPSNGTTDNSTNNNQNGSGTGTSR